MHTLVKNNLGESPLSSRGQVLNRSYHAWWGIPDPIVRCWLLGHRPVVRGRESRHRYIGCGRPGCGAMREVHPEIKERLAKGWEPHPGWLRDLEARGSGWHRHRQGEAGAQVVLYGQPRASLGAQLSVGGVGSETPFDGHLKLFGAELYWSLGFGGLLAEKITRGKGTREVGLFVERDTWARWPQWTVRAKLWVPRNGWNDKPRDRSRWRRFRELRWHPSVADKVWGKRYVQRDVHAETIVAVDLFDGEPPHLVKFELQRVTIGRPKQRDETKHRSWEVDWDIPSGSTPIGTRRQNGKWERGRTYGSGFELTHAQATSEDWAGHAVTEFRAAVARMRAREESRRG